MNKFRKLITITVTLVTTVLLLNFLALFYIREKSKVKASWEDVVNISWNQQAAGQQMLKDIMLLKGPNASAEAKFKTEFKDNVESFSVRQESLQTILSRDLAKESSASLGEVQALVTEAKPLHTQLLGLANQALN